MPGSLSLNVSLVATRETREGWSLLTVETEANGDSSSTFERSPSLVGCWACRAGTIDFLLPWLLSL